MLTEEKIRELWDEAVGDGWLLNHQHVIRFARLVEREVKLSVFVDTVAEMLVAWAAEYAKANLWHTGEPPAPGWYLVPRRECHHPRVQEAVGPPLVSATVEAYWALSEWVDATGASLRFQPVHYMPEPELPEEK